MHEAKTRLSELVKAVEERNETVVVCRDGRTVAEIRRRVRPRTTTSGSTRVPTRSRHQPRRRTHRLCRPREACSARDMASTIGQSEVTEWD